MKSFISQVALVSAATITNPCPNEYWEPVLDENGVLVENEGSIVCAPIPEAYKITCSPTGIELDIKYELMFDQVLDEQREEIGESLKIEPAKLGNCLNQVDQEETSLDYRFQLRYDQKNDNGDYCYTDVQGGQSNESIDETFINFVYRISPNNAAVTNEDGLNLSSVLNFSVHCALPESFRVSNDLDGLVAGADLSAAFVLNKYVFNQVDNEYLAVLGEPVHFKVEPIDQIPDFLDYFITGCEMEGMLDTGDAISFPLFQNVNCFHSYLQAYHTTPNDLNFDMFAFGVSEQALQSNRLNCQVRLCFNQDSEGSCYNQYVQQKEACTGEIYKAPETAVQYADHNTNLTEDSLESEVAQGLTEVDDEVAGLVDQLNAEAAE